MAKGINLALHEFEESMTNVINHSNLPICLVRLVLERLLNEIGKLEENALQQEIDAFAKEVDENGNEIP
jgi:hypothetical protein